MAALSPHAPTRPMEPVRPWRLRAFRKRLERNCLGPAVGMHDHPGGPASVGHCHLERVDGDPGLHPRVDRVADDPVGEHVLDRAQVDLALAGAVLGDVGQPQRVGALGAELPVDQVVVDGRAGFLVASLTPSCDVQPSCSVW